MISRRDVLKATGLLLLPVGASGFSLPTENLALAKMGLNKHSSIGLTGFERFHSIANPDEFMCPWGAYRDKDVSLWRETRHGWCYIPKESSTLYFNPEDFQQYSVWGKVLVQQGRLRENRIMCLEQQGDWFLTPLHLKDVSQAHLTHIPYPGEEFLEFSMPVG